MHACIQTIHTLYIHADALGGANLITQEDVWSKFIANRPLRGDPNASHTKSAAGDQGICMGYCVYMCIYSCIGLYVHL